MKRTLETVQEDLGKGATRPEAGYFYPSSREAWRQWLQEHHRSKQSVWLVFYRAKSGRPTLSWSEAVDEALCFGWIDSTRKPGEGDAFLQYFCRRKPRSGWSKINKEKVQQLITSGRMSPAGMECVETARQNGSWALFDEVEALLTPDDLAQALDSRTGAGDYFTGLSKSVRKRLLHWLVLAKLPETRQKRIKEIADLAAQGLLPRQFR